MNKFKFGFNTFTLFIIIILALIISVAVLKSSWQIGGDGFGYYSYVRSVVFDHDLQLTNEFQLYDSLYQHTTVKNWVTPIGELANPYAIGAAILWSPFVLVAKLVTSIWQFSDLYSLTGFNLPFQIAVGLGTWFYAIFGLLLIFRTLKKIIPVSFAWWSVLIVSGVSPIPYYLIYEPSMAHGLTLFTSGLIFYLAVKIYQSPTISYQQIIATGICVGLAFLVRWQDILLGIIPVGIIIYRLYQANYVQIKQYLKYLVLFILSFGIITWPQFAAWKYLYGQWLVIPQGNSFFHLVRPHFWQFLFSSYHGMFIIHPLLILGIIGLFIAYRKYKLLTGLLVFVWLAQFYINAGLADWYGGGSFGARRMISTIFILIFGLAFLCQKYCRQKSVILVLSIIIFIAMVFNGLLMIAYARQIIPLNAFTSYSQIYLAPIKTLFDL